MSPAMFSPFLEKVSLNQKKVVLLHQNGYIYPARSAPSLNPVDLISTQLLPQYRLKRIWV